MLVYAKGRFIVLGVA